MEFAQPLLEGTLLRRDRRFCAQIKLRSGEEITAHCANPGNMTGCSEPGSRVLVSCSPNPKRRFAHQIEVIYAGRTAVGVHVGRPASVVAEAIAAGSIPEVAGYASMRRQKPSQSMGVDLVLEGNGLRPCHIRTENVTLAVSGTAYHPDTPMGDDVPYLAHLTDLVRAGHRAMILFVVQRSDAKGFQLAEHVDDVFVQALRDTAARGVELLVYQAKVNKKAIRLGKAMPFVS